MLTRITGLSLAAMALVLAGCSATPFRALERFDLDVAWEGYERVVVRTVNGNVSLLCEDRDDIRISGVKHGRGATIAEAEETVERLTIVVEADRNDPKTLRIELEVPPELNRRSPGADFEIQAPIRCAADIATNNGYVRARGVTGLARLQSSNGRITAEDIEGRLEANTSNGRIVVDSLSGDCRLSTSNGGITVREARGGSVEATTSNGSLSVEAEPTADDEVVLRTSNGSIHVIVPEDLPADLHLDSSNGRARARLGDASLVSSTHSNSITWGVRFENLKTSINGGGCRIDAKTSNGSVILDTR